MRAQRLSGFLVVLVLIFPAKIFSQQQSPRIAQKSPHTLNFLEDFKEKKLQTNYVGLYAFINKASVLALANSNTIQIIRPGFCISNLPFFCKQEFQFEKNTSVPLRFRLGSLEYVDKLEGKK